MTIEHFTSALRGSGALVAALLCAATVAQADVEISNKPTSNMSCESGVCTATAQKAVLNVTDLQNMLASGDVAVKTGTIAKDIGIDQPLTWSSTSRLTLDAQRSVQIEKQVTVAGQGALTVTTNDSGAKAKDKTGEFIVVPEHGSVQFWDLSSSLMIDGNTYTLVDDIKTLAADIAANPSGVYALAKPYDASVDGTYTHPPIQGSFLGVFDGLGNNVSFLSINSTTTGDLVALFNWIGAGATVKHVGITKGILTGRDANGLGMLAGVNFGSIARCWGTGRITFPVTVSSGGLAAANEGLIIDSYADVRISGSGAGEQIGGLTGFNDIGATVTRAFAGHSIAVRGTGNVDVGGLIGENKGSAENGFSRTGLIEGRKVDGANFGGLVGKNDSTGTVSTSYAAGLMASKTGTPFGGGLVGFDGAKPGGMADTYWDLDMGIADPSQGAGNIKDDPGIAGLTTQQLQSGLPAGFDPKVWGIDPKMNDGFPYLRTLPIR